MESMLPWSMDGKCVQEDGKASTLSVPRVMIIVLDNPNPKLQSVAIAESIRDQGCQFTWLCLVLLGSRVAGI